jgi:glyoxylase I family protein
MAVTFSHIALNCENPAATEAFYTKHFGFRRTRVVPLGDEEIVFIKAGAIYLEIFKAKGTAPAPPEKDGPGHRGWRHIAFTVEDVDRKLAEMGSDARVSLGPLSFDDFIPGWRAAWLADPEGNIVEISQGYTDQDNPPSN